MGYVPAPPPILLNLDRFGMPRDYATYVWLLYRRRVNDDSPARRAFLAGGYGLDVGEMWFRQIGPSHDTR